MKYLPIVVAVIFLIWHKLYINYQIQKENSAKYDFIITEVLESNTGTRACDLKSKDGVYRFWNYSVGSRDGMKVGDRLIKERDAKLIYIYRKDSTGANKVVAIIHRLWD